MPAKFTNIEKKGLFMTKVNTEFTAFAEKQNIKFPQKTKTIAHKKTAITSKTAIMNHKDCPPETKLQLKKEIEMIKKEIKQMENEAKQAKSKENKEKSIFKK